jgi:uncharacterized cofD-like protein
MKHDLARARVVVFGGGTGSFTLLQALKGHVTDLASIVTMSDDGGSTGVLRDELGVLPAGDVRQCLVALSDQFAVRELFNYRFSDGRLSGQSLGNIILSGLELQHGSFTEAVRVAGEILHIQGRVIPVTLGNHRLHLQDGPRLIKGEHQIDTYRVQHRTAVVSLEPRAALNPAAAEAIAAADLLIIAPGGMYESILPIFTVDGMVEAFTASRARKVYIANLVNKPRHTDGWHIVDYVEELERYLGQGTIDAVFYNTAPMPADLGSKYAAEGELPVLDTPARFGEVGAQLIGEAFVANELVLPNKAEKGMKRTLIRHDGNQVLQALKTYMNAA